jgi:uncharacterized membrane protein
MTWVLLISGFAMALVAGVFLSFSDFVMRGLVQAPAHAGAAGMVGLNRTVYRSAFMVLLMGFVPGAPILAGLALWRLEGLAQGLVLAGAALYLAGVVAVTGGGNVPMNRRLEAVEGDARASASYWAEYAPRWTRLNHIRVACAAGAAAAWIWAGALL